MKHIEAKYELPENCIAISSMDLNSRGFFFGEIEGRWFFITSEEKKSNQRVDPTVKTPVELGKVQGTAGHP